MDLGDLRSVVAFARTFERQLGGAPLHALINNAGANFMGRDPWHTAAGVAGIPQVGFRSCRHLCLCMYFRPKEGAICMVAQRGQIEPCQELQCGAGWVSSRPSNLVTSGSRI